MSLKPTSPARPEPPIPSLQHTDRLPTDRTLLEGRLNTHVADLQSIARNMDWLNEQIELRVIALQRLERDAKEDAARFAIWDKEIASMQTNAQKAEEAGKRTRVGSEGKGNAAAGSGYIKGEHTPGDEKTAVNMGIKEMKGRIVAFRKLKKALEKSTMWQLEEMWRVEKAMGKEPGTWMRLGLEGEEEEEGEENVLPDRKWSKDM